MRGMSLFARPLYVLSLAYFKVWVALLTTWMACMMCFLCRSYSFPLALTSYLHRWLQGGTQSLEVEVVVTHGWQS